MAMTNILREIGVKVSLLFDKSKIQEATKAVGEVAYSMRNVASEVAAATGALVGMAAVSSHNSRTLQQNAAALGINVERLQELEYAAKVAGGVSREELGGALEGISRTLFEARNNSTEAARTLIRLGVPLDVLANKTVTADQIMLVLAERFKTMPDGMYKTALASEAFGSAGAALIPLLNKGAAGIAQMGREGRSLGAVLNKGFIDQGAEFDRQLTKIWFVLKNISFVMGGQLIKYLYPIVIQFERFIQANRKFIALGIASVMKSIGIYLQIVFKVVGFLAEKFKVLVEYLGGVERLSKLIAIAFGVFTAGKIITGLATLVTSFRAVLGVFSLMNIQTMALGASFALLFLFIQDFFSKDSVIKEWFKSFKKEFPNLAGLATDFVTVMVTGANMIAEGWKNIWSYIEPIKNFFSCDLLTKSMDAAEKFVGYLRSGDLGSKLYDLTHGTEEKTVAATPGITAQVAGKSPISNNMSATINVTVPTGTSPSNASAIVSSGVQDGFEAILRATRNQSIGGVAY